MSRDDRAQIPASLLEPGTLDFTQHWQTLIRCKWWILSFALLGAMLTAFALLFVTPRYQASATLMIEAQESKVLSIEEVYGLDFSRKEYFQTQHEVLRSRHIAQRVVDELGLAEHAYFDPDQQPPSVLPVGRWLSEFRQWLKQQLPALAERGESEATETSQAQSHNKKVIDSFRAGLSIIPVKNTQMVIIAYESPSPWLSAQIANKVAEVYIDNYLQAKLDMTSKAASWLNDSLAGLKTKLSVAEKRLADFYEQEKLVDLDGVVGLAADELQGLNEQLLHAQNRLEQSRTIYQQVNLQSADMSTLSRLPEVLNHPSIQNVRRAEIEAQRKHSDLSKVFGPKHPRMISAQAELDTIRQNFNSQVRELVSGINIDYQSLQSQVQGLKTAVEQAKQNFRRLTALETQHKALQREVDINQQMYNAFFTRLKETSELEGFESANARVLDSAQVPSVPSKPNKQLLVLLALVVFAVLGGILAIVLDTLYNGIRSVRDAERKLGYRTLGVIPKQKKPRRKDLPLRHYFQSDQHSFTEAFRTLRTNLMMLTVEFEQRTWIVTSSVPGEGKTMTSANLAFAMGQLGRTLLVDTDLRRSSLAGLFEQPQFQPGLSNVLSNTHRLDECIVKLPEWEIDLLTAGSPSANSQELLASQRFGQMMNKLKAHYQYIILDSAPTLAVSDALVTVPHCNALVYVVKAEAATAHQIKAGLSRFMQSGCRIDGVVLNHLDIKKASKMDGYQAAYEQYGYGVPAG
ncbi:polysaccharide biosynthesis tyrosine autokinase [Bowmanella sp. Y26]|uniref:GumC family protein n=1 Tax=Bowmanella yangjiangensis TaxID=2811230 RepID=UPI001BDDA66D|nr:polysaccharide biosynthesis tyrosine autokinase [Bowmanella yangjiangensis]MBT1065578.1 polysaccharide biosynthesis tyrosine autokinase [Bowmanella yangjiangensis]